MCCVYKSVRKKKSHPVSSRNRVTGGAPLPPPPHLQANRVAEKGEITRKNMETKDGGMVVLGVAAAILASGPVNTSTAYSSGGGLSSSLGGDGGCGGGGGGGC
ncbi:hypothetical protein HAX54_016637 [Datura stramonium]|uniref:Uncharacterized protein n=1 Tax=Datura stramonium TaxID=4076 RepID=A0ABS8UJ64_DATST|nr:hypothetical protein [Datura stramonium]